MGVDFLLEGSVRRDMPRRTAASPAVRRHAPHLDLTAIEDASEAELQSLWTATFGNPPPSDLAAGLMRLVLAWQAQRRVHGGLDRDTALRLCDLRRGLPRNPQYRLNPIGDLIPGTVLTRTWKGEEHLVYVLENAFAWRGRTYQSLTAVAHAITNGPWPGPSFFGLYKPPRKRLVGAEP